MEKILVIAFVFLSLILTFWALIDVSRSRFKNSSQRTIWLMIVLFLPIWGPIIYFQIRRKLVTKEKRVFNPNFNKR